MKGGFKYKMVLGFILGLSVILLTDTARAEESKPTKSFFERLTGGIQPNGANYYMAPETPMRLHLHRDERFGVHLHNIEFRFSDQPGLYANAGQSVLQFQTPTSELEASGFILPNLLFAQVVIEPRDLLGRGLGDSLAARIDSANAPSGIVRDAFFDFIIAPETAVLRMGQARIPFGIEVQTPGGLLPFINRAYLDLKTPHNRGAENTAFANAEMLQERDIGVQIRGRTPSFEYAFGGYNGSGINVNDTNSNKDFVGRLGYNPLPGLRFGVSGYKGTATDILKENVERNRTGVDFEVLPSLIPRVRLMGEYAIGKDGPFERKSWYTSGFYELIPQRSPTSPSLWFIVRYDEMRDQDRFSRTTVGLNYFILNAIEATTGYWKQIKLQLNYEMRYHRDGLPTDAFAKDLFMAQMTVRY